MSKMAMKSAIFVATLFVSYVTGINSTVCDYTKYVAYGFADVTHTHRFQSAVRSSSPDWYQDRMQFFAYNYNGHKWDKRTLTWAIGKESKRVDVGNVPAAAERAFKQWSAVTPFWFQRRSLSDKPDITISFENFDGAKKHQLCDIKFPYGITLDNDGVTLLINDAKSWNNVPWNKWVYNLNYALLFLVSWCLGLGPSNDPDAVMSRDNPRFDLIYENYDLNRDDIIGIQRLYRFPELQDGGPYICRPSSPEQKSWPQERRQKPQERGSGSQERGQGLQESGKRWSRESEPSSSRPRPSSSYPPPSTPSSSNCPPPTPLSSRPEPPTPESGSSSQGAVSWSSNPTPPQTPSSTPLRVRPLSWKPPPPQ